MASIAEESIRKSAIASLTASERKLLVEMALRNVSGSGYRTNERPSRLINRGLASINSVGEYVVSFRGLKAAVDMGIGGEKLKSSRAVRLLGL